MWSDSGVVVSIKKYGERSRLIDIFFRDRGKVSGLARCYDGLRASQFDIVDVEYVAKKVGGTGSWSVKSVMSIWPSILHKPLYLLICQSVCYSIANLLYSNIKYSGLFEVVSRLLDALKTCNEKEILNLYGYFDLFLLYALGYGFDRKCHCGKASCTITQYGDAFCLDCIGDGDYFCVPKIWVNWFNLDFSIYNCSDLLQSFTIVDHFLYRYFPTFNNSFKVMLMSMVVSN